MGDDALSTALEAALLRQLLATWRTLNDSYWKGRLQPPTLALADGAHKLGQWLAAERRIELSRAFVVDGAWGAVVEVLKHEMAHQFVTEALGDPDPTPHGPAFRAVCERHGIDASAAGVPAAAPTPEADRVLSRVAKLLALAESPNVHEAESAMARLTAVPQTSRTLPRLPSRGRHTGTQMHSTKKWSLRMLARMRSASETRPVGVPRWRNE